MIMNYFETYLRPLIDKAGNEINKFPVWFNILGVYSINESMLHILCVTHGTLLRMGHS